ncbi:hypothetical protein N8502_00760 [Gammaproteobacteria bacterium]|nr:hypothetical protein [Gammaproteobacteria bacterium]
MNNKLFLAALLITPIAVLLFSTLSFQSGFAPKDTRNNGTFFQEFFDVTNIGLTTEAGTLEFEDAKWIFGTYGLQSDDLEQALYLMRQLNVALNRDIYKLKRVVFTQPNTTMDNALMDYPRTEIILDTTGSLYKTIGDMEGDNFFKEQKIFIIDPYGRAVMFFPVSMDPKLILKDLKVLI